MSSCHITVDVTLPPTQPGMHTVLEISTDVSCWAVHRTCQTLKRQRLYRAGSPVVEKRIDRCPAAPLPHYCPVAPPHYEHRVLS